MLLIYIDKQTNRLGYTINLIFRDILGVDFNVTTNKDQFVALECEKLSYSKSKVYDELHITSTNLLFETTISSQEIDYYTKDDIPYLFKIYNKDEVLGFDIFAAIFYLVSRYEEYLPFIQDVHSRFRANDSIAYQKGFLLKPVVNIWVNLLKEELKKKYPQMVFKQRKFNFLNTIDVDMAYSYKGKGLYRNCGGFVRDLINGNFEDCGKRIRVLWFKEKDPYDSFDYILSTLTKYKLKTLFFILFGQNDKYDKNISPYNRRFQLLVKYLGDYAKIGIHPSYFCFDSPEEMPMQVKLLSSTIHKAITRSRFHYLRFRLPKSYRTLIDNEITEDFSMGYADQVGFRAGICTSFNFYDLERDCETKLRVHPFAFMDVALKNGLGLKEEAVIKKIKYLIDQVRDVDGDLISIWHNESLSNYKEWKNWRQIYEKQIEYVINK